MRRSRQEDRGVSCTPLSGLWTHDSVCHVVLGLSCWKGLGLPLRGSPLCHVGWVSDRGWNVPFCWARDSLSCVVRGLSSSEVLDFSLRDSPLYHAGWVGDQGWGVPLVIWILSDFYTECMGLAGDMPGVVPLGGSLGPLVTVFIK